MKSINSIQPADRVYNIKEYYFSKKLREVAEMNARGLDVISLGVGGPDRMPHSSVIETLCHTAQQSDVHSYQPYTGIRELRSAFADWYGRHYSVRLDPDSEILPLNGSKEGVLDISMAFLNPGDGVLVPDPGYPTYTSVSKLLGADIYTYNLTEENDWLPDFDELEKLPLDKIKLMWVNYPHMPTGRRATSETFEKLVAFGRRHGIVIAQDNAYSFILNDKPLSILATEGAGDIALELNSLSKSHNMAGWRMGMIAGNATFINWILKVKSNLDSGQFRAVQQAATRALTVGNEWYTTLNEQYARRRQIAEQIMDTLGCRFDPSQRGLFLWGRVPDTYECGETLADKVLYEARVFITPGFIFGKNGNRYVRISLCATDEKMNEALSRIRKVFA